MMTGHGILPAVMRSAVLALAFFAACTDENAPSAGLQANRVRTLSQQGAPIYPEERPFWNLAQRFPSSAGFFRDSVTDDIVVSLTDMQDAAAVTTELRSSLARQLVRARRRNPRADVVARRATYTFLQLKEWRDQMGQAFAISGVDWLDLDEARNRVVLGVDPGTDVQPIRSLARDLGVPEEAVDFDVDGPALPLSALTDSIRPIEGATEIQAESASAAIKACTLGFPAIWNGTRAFVTASHCSSNLFAVDSTHEYQPTVPTTHADSMTHSPIGTEVADYSPHTCPPGVTGTGCVYADAAVYQFTGDSSQWVLGRIARPTFGCLPGPCSPPNLQIGGYFSITATDGSIMQNDLVSHIGEATGWSQDYVVTSTCVNEKFPGTSYVVLCQQHAGFGGGSGDSGGPVLLNIGLSSDTTVTLGGIYWAQTRKYGVFSPWSGIATDYPGLVVH